jgi:preprotein translocase subunit SecF
MFELLALKNTVNFLKHAKVISFLSVAMVVASIGLLASKGLNWGLDFTGGTVVEVEFESAAQLDNMRQHALVPELHGIVIQQFGTPRDVMLRLPVLESVSSEAQVQAVRALVAEFDANASIKRVEFVGPAVGQELAEQGGLAVLVALICIMVYVSFRFEWRLALGSVSALFHDVLVTLGLFSLLQIEFDLTVLAGVLTVVGYSLNDTIVVYDRIRENFIKMRKGTPEDVVNTSITQTMSRTVITTCTTLFVVIALFAQGGAHIHGFASALLMGIAVGTYSSIYVASFLAIKLGICREHMLPVHVDKEGEDLEELIF